MFKGSWAAAPVGQETTGIPYHKLVLDELIRLVVDNSDQEALKEFHQNRSVFRYGGKGTLLLAAFLDRLRTSTQKIGWSDQKKATEIANRAYDLTLDKFFNLPAPGINDGPDCRCYFRAFLERLEASKRTGADEGQLSAEARSGVILQRLVLRHFRLSTWEARREQNPFWSRYKWEIKGKSIYLMLPRSLGSAKRRAWLEDNITDPAPGKPGEQRRIQEIIDTRLAGERFVSLTEALEQHTASQVGREVGYEYDLSLSLAANVAQEKAGAIDSQRPAIRALGAGRLKEMILAIFEDLAAENYSQKDIARKFGLSTGTLSRFAGQDWGKKDGLEVVPDLWANTANVIAKNKVFEEFAVEAGVGETIHQIRATSNPNDGKAVHRV